MGVDQFASRTDTNGARMPLTDALGSVLALVDDAGAIQTEYIYGPFGATTASGQASANASQFTGRDNDGTGLYYYRARYYSPALQRFISEDPLGYWAADTDRPVQGCIGALQRATRMGCPLVLPHEWV